MAANRIRDRCSIRATKKSEDLSELISLVMMQQKLRT